MTGQDPGHLTERIALHRMQRRCGHTDPHAVAQREDDSQRVVRGGLDPVGEVLLERVELATLGYVGRARLVELVKRSPVLASVAEVAQRRELDPGLLALPQILRELVIIECSKIQLQSDPLDSHDRTSGIDDYRLGMSVVRLDDVLAEVLQHPEDYGISIIAVDGPQGSGKTTLAARIAARIGAPLIQTDDFVSWVDLVGWWPRFEAQVLEPLLSGGDAHYQVRDWENDEFGTSLKGWKTVGWSPLVVLEGLTCTRAAIADRLAYRIWVEAPDEVRLRRGLERDGESHRELWLASMTTERQFFAHDATRTRADLRVNGNSDISHDQESEVVLLE